MLKMTKVFLKKSHVRNRLLDIIAEAKDGRLVSALHKIDVLHNEFPQHGIILNEKGNIYSKYLGSGIHAHEFYCQAVKIDDGCIAALINATDYSATKADFRKWSTKALRQVTNIQFTSRIQQILIQLDDHVPYEVFLAANTQKHCEAKKYGLSAAFAELLLLHPEIPETDVLRIRRNRAQCLRELDILAANSYTYRKEVFPVNERLALLSALEELERTILIDKYDHELWNLKAAWCILLNRFEEANQCAETSLNNAPNNYIKPFVNKVIALKALGRETELSACLAEALKRVNEDNTHADIIQMKKILY